MDTTEAGVNVGRAGKGFICLCVDMFSINGWCASVDVSGVGSVGGRRCG